MMVGLRTAFSVLALLIFVTWVKGEIEIPLTCSDLGGDCVSMENNTCPFKVDFPGCDEDQICCNPNGKKQGQGTAMFPLPGPTIPPGPIRDHRGTTRPSPGTTRPPPDTTRSPPGTTRPPPGPTCPPTVPTLLPPVQTILPPFPTLFPPGNSQVTCMVAEYEGICESKCTLRRLKVGSCSDGSECCGCQPDCSCLRSYGFCTENPAFCDGKTENDWCGGNNCTCCVPDCPATPVCLSAGGRCAKSCDGNEESHPTIGCNKENSDACRCCVPKVEKKCKNTFWCRLYKGQCQEKCDSASHYSHRTGNLCGNQGCVCCKKHSK